MRAGPTCPTTSSGVAGSSTCSRRRPTAAGRSTIRASTMSRGIPRPGKRGRDGRRAHGKPALTPTRRVRVALAALGFVTAIGTIGYVLIEGLSVVDALYLTVATLTTVGYGDVVPHTTAGRLFTIVLILSGVGTALYLFT